MSKQRITDRPVCVTGASGFVGSHIVHRLLEEGYRVHASVRAPDDLDKYGFLLSFPGADDRLELVGGDLLEQGAYDAAVDGCEFVIHTASPYVLDVDDPQRDLVDPAVEGTENVLCSCTRSDQTKKVVLTSSMAAITDEPEPDRVLTEDDWNEKSTLERNPYYLSKTLAERRAWQYVEEDDPDLDLVVINPFTVIGPAFNARLNTTNSIFVELLTGGFPGIIRMTWGFVDVRDVARAHILAMQNDDAEGRHICAHKTVAMAGLTKLLKENGYGDYDLPRLNLANRLGDFAVKLFSYTQPKGTGVYLRTHIGRAPRFDNTKIRQELGLQFRPLEQAILETVEDLRRWGHIPDR